MKSFLKGFVYAIKGIAFCLKNERNMRIHLCFTIYMFSFLTVYDFFEISKAEYAVLLALCALVLSLEAVNTAVEKTVDLATKELHPLAKVAKDSAAGAVLISAVFSVIAGFVILWQPEAFRKMYEYYCDNISMLIVLVISLIIALVFVFLPAYLKDKKGNKNE